jgi:hypothetical protein
MENQPNEEVITQQDANDNKPEFLSKPEEDWTTEDAVEAKKYAQTVFAQKEHWREKATKPKVEVPQETKQNKDGNIDSTTLEKLELKIDGYSDDEVSFIQQNGGKKALDNVLVKQAIETIREKRKAEEAMITDSGAKSDIEKKYSDNELKNMPLEELEKILPKA